jgi:hypothetical protein
MKINFEYSGVYDNFWKNYLELYYKVHKNPKTRKILNSYPSGNKLKNYVDSIENYWRKDEKIILSAISKITGLKWKEGIKVYLVGKCIPYSKPLTMYPHKTKQDFRDVLIHELIHNIQSQNSEIYKKWAKFVKNKYKDESKLTRRHIFLHAVHKKIYLELFNKNRLKKNIEKSNHSKPYKRAWEIVEREGHENIIKRFKLLNLEKKKK